MSIPDIPVYTQDPADHLDYEVDWTAYLPNGDTIESYVVTPADGLTITSDSATDSTTTMWLSGGTAGVTYTIPTKITTVVGRVIERSIKLRVAEV